MERARLEILGLVTTFNYLMIGLETLSHSDAAQRVKEAKAYYNASLILLDAFPGLIDELAGHPVMVKARRTLRHH